MVDKVNYKRVCRKCGEWYTTGTVICPDCNKAQEEDKIAKQKERILEGLNTADDNMLAELEKILGIK